MVEAKSNPGKVYAKRFIKESSIVFVALVVTALVGFLLRVFLARSLGLAEYGLFYSVLALILIVSTFRDLGVGQAVSIFIPKFLIEKQYGKLKSIIAFYAFVQIAYSLVAGLVLFLFSDQIALTFFGTSSASLVIKFLSGWFFFEAIFSTLKASFQGFHEITPYSVLGFLEIFLPFVLVVFLIGTFGANAANVGLAYLLGLFITVLIALGIFMKKHSDLLKEKTRISKPLLKELFAFILPALIGGVMGTILGQLNTLLLTSLRSLSDAGLYQVAYTIAELLAYFAMTIRIVLIPMASELWAKREKGVLGQAMSSLIKFSFIFIIPVALIVISYPNVVISVLFGSEYGAASTVLQILIINAVVGMILIIPEKTILGIGKFNANTILLIVRASLLVFFNLFLIPLYGATGAAIAILLSTLGGLFPTLYMARNFIKFKVPSSSIFKAVVGSLLTLLMVAGLKTVIILPPLVELFVVMIPCLTFYAMWVLFTHTLDFNDLLLLKNNLPIPDWIIRFAKKFVGKVPIK